MTILDPRQEALCEQSQWDFRRPGAMFTSCTLKRSPEQSHTQGLADLPWLDGPDLFFELVGDWLEPTLHVA